jgi:hypothetical protein
MQSVASWHHSVGVCLLWVLCPSCCLQLCATATCSLNPTAHWIAQVYALVEQQQAQPQQPGAALPAQQLLRCVSTLAGLKYTQPVQLAAWLEAATADQCASASRASQPATAAAASTGSYRQVLSGLRMRDLSTLIANLARSGVRPSNLWLLAFMQVSHRAGLYAQQDAAQTGVHEGAVEHHHVCAYCARCLACS